MIDSSHAPDDESSRGRSAELSPGCPGRSTHVTWQRAASCVSRPRLVAALKFVPGR
ncbi:MAG: hypothetical protein AVDCRST_MAG47-59 [uncultured Nocardioidaceae bacterium]|uniref:Uncharacterized protein n=1 Tax=uncultured Nocardioidaceae bacterium TaxID=253824 RepID=A0A6J4MIT5_9ACTN|nr:MAG: hypothetical protein AVDCRST_MAG47-59 [uncultured Nocardioidaceae bacterium]